MVTIKTTEIDDKIADLYHEVVSELLAIPGLRMRSLVHELGELLSNPRGHKWYEATVVFTYDGTRYELAQRRGDTPGGWQIKLEREGYSAVYLKPPCSLKAAAHELAHSLHAGFSSCAEFAEAIGGKDDPPDTKVFTPQPAPLAELRKVMEFRGKSYRKRPIVIRAFRCKADRSVETLEGTMKASPGDWIIEGVQGEFYPCKDDIFRATYDEAEVEG